MVEITLFELTFPDARFTAEAEFNAPFAGRGASSDADDGDEPDAEPEAASGGPSPESVAALVIGLLSVAALLWLRRGRRTADHESSD